MRRVVLAAILLASAWTTLPRLGAMLSEAWRLRGLSLEERRARTMGPFYESLRQLPADEPLALIGDGTQASIDTSVFANYYLYPRRTKMYFNVDFYRADRQHPRTVISVRDTLKVTTYEELRMATVRRTLLDFPVSEVPREFFVPIVCSLDGPPPDTYTTNAIFEGDARVTLTLQPSGDTKTIDVRGRAAYHDLLFEVFGKSGWEWMRVTSDAPLRAAFRFSNRGKRESLPLPTYATPPRPPYRFADADWLWLLNLGDEPIAVPVNGPAHILAPRALRQIEGQPQLLVESNGPLVAFTSKKDPKGRTHFSWPAW